MGRTALVPLGTIAVYICLPLLVGFIGTNLSSILFFFESSSVLVSPRINWGVARKGGLCVYIAGLCAPFRGPHFDRFLVVAVRQGGTAQLSSTGFADCCGCPRYSRGLYARK